MKVYSVFAVITSFMLTSCVPAVLGSGAAVGSAAVEDRGMDGAMADQTIRARINYEWTQSPENFEGIEITVYNGKVLLTGTARTEADRTAAVRLAKVAQGVREVIDAIDIGEEGSFPDLARDAWISAKVRNANLFDDRIYSPNFAVRTEDKIVYLLGVAESEDEHQAVLQNAHDVKGVRRVVDLVEVRVSMPSHPDAEGAPVTRVEVS